MSHKSAEAEARYKEKVLFHYRREWDETVRIRKEHRPMIDAKLVIDMLMGSWPTQPAPRAFVVHACEPLTYRTDLRVLCGTGFGS